MRTPTVTLYGESYGIYADESDLNITNSNVTIDTDESVYLPYGMYYGQYSECHHKRKDREQTMDHPTGN